MLKSLFSPKPATLAGRALYAEVSAAARRPVFYLQGGAPDTPEGRFELYLIHLVLALHRLKGEGEEARPVSQALFDAFVRGLDDGLREMGVGDLSVGKKMRKLGEAIYGRIKGYDAALAAADPAAEVQALVARTLFAGETERAGFISAYVVEAASALQAQPTEALLEGRIAFPAPEAAELAA